MRKIASYIILAISLCMAVVMNNHHKISFPKFYEITPFPLETQPDEITCGPTSVLMTLKYFGKVTTLDEVKSFTKTEWFEYKGRKIGMTAPDYIPVAFKSYGINTKQRVGDIRLIKNYVSKDKPVIVLLRSGSTTWHYVVVVGYNERNLIIADPGGGNRWEITEQNFVGAWTFKTDMQGESLQQDCSSCGGTGKWLKINLGPLSTCEVCGGSGKQYDYLVTLLAAGEVVPKTMVFPE